MPLSRIIIESSDDWLRLIQAIGRSFLIPLTLVLLFVQWFREDVNTWFRIAYSFILEILHIIPCVLGQVGLIDYEPIHDVVAARKAILENEPNLLGRIYKRILLKYTTGWRILTTHGGTAYDQLLRVGPVIIQRYHKLLNIWKLTKETEDWIWHYPKCFVKIIVKRFNGSGDDNSRNKEDQNLRPYNSRKNPSKPQTQRKIQPTNSGAGPTRRVVGINTLPSTAIQFNKNDVNIEELISNYEDYESDDNEDEMTSENIDQENYPKTEPLAQFDRGTIFNVLSPISKNSKLINSSPLDIKELNFKPKLVENKGKYDDVKLCIIQIMDNKSYDDGSFGPSFVRLTWHCCATYDKETGTGGSNGATIRLPPELTDDGNTGLQPAMLALEVVKHKYPWISYADLYTFAGVVAIEAMSGPKIDWKPGRIDVYETKFVPPNGRLPVASKKADHVRETFGRMGFNDQEMVALIGCHTLGRTHKKYSGWNGKWTDNPIRFDNDFYKLLLNDSWKKGKVPETGRVQYFDKRDKEIMMLQTDMELIFDKEFKKWVEIYAKDKGKYFEDFSKAFVKLIELGVQRDETGFANVKTIVV